VYHTSGHKCKSDVGSVMARIPAPPGGVSLDKLGPVRHTTKHCFTGTLTSTLPFRLLASRAPDEASRERPRTMDTRTSWLRTDTGRISRSSSSFPPRRRWSWVLCAANRVLQRALWLSSNDTKGVKRLQGLGQVTVILG